MEKSVKLIVEAIDNAEANDAGDTAAERLQDLITSGVLDEGVVQMDVFISALHEIQLPAVVCRIGSEDAVIYADLSITPLICDELIINGSASVNNASGIGAYHSPEGDELPFTVSYADFMFLVMGAIDEIKHSSAGFKDLKAKVEAAKWSFSANKEADDKRRSIRHHMIELIKDFRTPVVVSESDLEDRKDWSDADVQKLDQLLKTLMIALTPPDEPWQGVKIISSTAVYPAEIELYVDDDVLRSAIVALAEMEKFVGYEFEVARQDAYRMEDWDKVPFEVTEIEIDLDEVTAAEKEAAQSELKSLIKQNRKISPDLRSDIKSRLVG
jgi:hypothetical protein